MGTRGAHGDRFTGVEGRGALKEWGKEIVCERGGVREKKRKGVDIGGHGKVWVIEAKHGWRGVSHADYSYQYPAHGRSAWEATLGGESSPCWSQPLCALSHTLPCPVLYSCPTQVVRTLVPNFARTPHTLYNDLAECVHSVQLKPVLCTPQAENEALRDLLLELTSDKLSSQSRTALAAGTAAMAAAAGIGRVLEPLA